MTFTTFIEFLLEIADRYYYYDVNKFSGTSVVEYSYAALRRPQPANEQSVPVSTTQVMKKKGRMSREERKVF